MNAPRTAAPSTARRPTVPPRRPAAAATAPQPTAPSTRPDPDNEKFEAKARELLAPAADRPAVVVGAEVQAIRREYRSGQGRFEALRRLALTRLAYADAAWGRDPRMKLSEFERLEAQEFFSAYQIAVKPAPAAVPAMPQPAAAPSTPARENAGKPADTAAILAELKALRAEIAALRARLENAPSTPGVGGEACTEFLMDAVKVGADEKTGEKTYKAQGPSYKKYGVRIWPEVLPELGVDAGALKFGENRLRQPVKVRALLVDGKAKKVIGPA